MIEIKTYCNFNMMYVRGLKHGETLQIVGCGRQMGSTDLEYPKSASLEEDLQREIYLKLHFYQ